MNPISSVPGIVQGASPTPVGGATSGGGTPKSDGVGFADSLQKVSDLQAEADDLATQVATGDLQDIHDFMAASSKASMAMELTVAVRNRAVEAYQEIMRMQI